MIRHAKGCLKFVLLHKSSGLGLMEELSKLTDNLGYTYNTSLPEVRYRKLVGTFQSKGKKV